MKLKFIKQAGRDANSVFEVNGMLKYFDGETDSELTMSYNNAVLFSYVFTGQVGDTEKRVIMDVSDRLRMTLYEVDNDWDVTIKIIE